MALTHSTYVAHMCPSASSPGRCYRSGLCVCVCILLSITYRVGAFYFVVTNMVFGSFSAIELFIKERPLFMYVQIRVLMMTLQYTYSHQSARGYYRVSAFFLTKVFCDLLPMRIIPVIFYSAISYWMLGE